jgi:anti-sigma factor (TIGR02949 family)
MTDCDRAKAELEEYLHHELRSEDAADIADHVATCLECDGEYQVGLVLMTAVRRACSEIAPEDLREQVLGRLREIQSHSASA